MTTLLSSLLRLPSIASSSRSIHSISTRSIPSPVVVRGLYELPRGLQLTGVVVEAGKMKQTSTVSVASRVTDHKTLKVFTTNKKYLIHDIDSACSLGDKVIIRNCRPVSKRKRFELMKIISTAKVATEEGIEAIEVEREEIVVPEVVEDGGEKIEEAKL